MIILGGEELSFLLVVLCSSVLLYVPQIQYLKKIKLYSLNKSLSAELV